MVLNGVGAQGSYGYHTYYGQTTSTAPPNGAKPRRSPADQGLFKEA